MLLERYTMEEQIGIGGMSVVTQAHDRLTGKTVALKNLSMDDRMALMPDYRTEELKLALMREFQIMAALRHPNIAEVHDFGFDENEQPYFSIEYLAGAQPFDDALRDQPLEQQIEGMLQLLRALTYLHHHDIIHNDLKPSNVLVHEGVVKVLDFGLATQQGLATSDGTLRYTAPEVMRGEHATPPADLYSAGVMVYEAVTGQLPIYEGRLEAFMEAVQTRTPDPTPLPERLRPIIMRLLEKDPTKRYQRAADVIEALDAHEEAAASTLRAAKFVGRGLELVRFLHQLQRARDGQGSVWLLGGETGVGKSRLVDEIATHAMTLGTIVVRGQGVEEGGVAYQLWREPLRRLALSTTLTDETISVLVEIAPDLPELLGRDIQPAPPLDGQAAQQRLTLALLDLIRDQPKPLLLILEDLHWAVESLDLLKLFAMVSRALPLVVIGTYRSDAMPDLPEQLPQAEHMHLERLDKQAITEMCKALLSEAPPALVTYVHQHSEGNALLMVEVLHALAEHSGRLHAITPDNLPETLPTIDALLKRRVAHLPAEHLPALYRAAAAAREVDEAILKHFTPDPKAFITAGVQAGLFIRKEEGWQFAHSQLRQAVLDDLPDRKAIYTDVAQAVERIYPERTNMLAFYWHEAGHYLKEATRALDAAKKLQTVSNYTHAQQIVRRAFENAPNDMLRLQLRLQETHIRLTQGESPSEEVKAAWVQARKLGAEESEALALQQLGTIAWKSGTYAEAETFINLSNTLAEKLNLPKIIASNQGSLGVISAMQGEYEEAITHFEKSLTHARQHDLQQAIGSSLSNLGLAHQFSGDYDKAADYYQQSIAVAEAIGNRHGLGSTYNNLGLMAQEQGKLDEAEAHYQKGLAIRREIGDLWGLTLNLSTLATLHIAQGDITAARAALKEAAEVALRIASPRQQMWVLVAAIKLALHEGDAAQANQWAGLVTAHPAADQANREEITKLDTAFDAALPTWRDTREAGGDLTAIMAEIAAQR